MTNSQYIIEGGAPGRERLRVLSDILRPTTESLLRRAGVSAGMSCLDVGCGGGDVTRLLASLVGPNGAVTGIDLDETALAIAREEAAAAGVAHIRFEHADAAKLDARHEYDVVYARFLLSHVVDPEETVRQLRQVLRPGGLIIIEDVEFAGHFCHPACDAFLRFVDLYVQAATRRGVDANVGIRVPSYLLNTGYSDVQVNVIQPASLDSRTKSLVPITMERIADTVHAESLASREELADLVARLYQAAEDPAQLLSYPRILQVWARSPGTIAT